MSNLDAKTKTDSAESLSTDGLGHMPRHPTLDECGAAGNGGTYSAAVYTEGGLPDTTDERARFEAYMRGHCWDAGKYDDRLHCYDTTTVRMLYGVWRDRGSLPTVWPNDQIQGAEPLAAKAPAGMPG